MDKEEASARKKLKSRDDASPVTKESVESKMSDSRELSKVQTPFTYNPTPTDSHLSSQSPTSASCVNLTMMSSDESSGVSLLLGEEKVNCAGT
ncbi:uncharacterized protein MEPE_05509 [Melanopsichium pennsylvanicum]|uniref:Uncharacterized protein n=1 Tax=Melanopsichium pennsylvanicum TaxID=63383 RepID=A0AAJ4XQT3_9BASI|nr:uncharacterized protein MEPE_05509 [Melanopsichium pennsylvanicum]